MACKSVKQEENHGKGPRWSRAGNQMGNLSLGVKRSSKIIHAFFGIREFLPLAALVMTAGCIQTGPASNHPSNSSLSADAASRRAIAEFKQGDHAAALADFNKAIELNPRSAAAYANRASAESSKLEGHGQEYNQTNYMRP
jgi:tetratricopeptide (TPR) repeat protein